jgi:hypothetical protein
MNDNQGLESIASPPTEVRRTPIGEALLHPVALGAVLVLLFNDHWLKAHHPGLLSGKLSDFAGLVFFPLLLATLMDAAARLARRRPDTSRFLVIAIVMTGLGFTAVKLTDIGAEAFRRVWALMQWPAHALVARRVVAIGRVRVVKDATDLFALPMLSVAYWIGRRYFSRS